MPEQNLNPDAEIAAGEAIYDAFSGQFGDLSGNDCDNMAEVAIRAYFSALPAQPVMLFDAVVLNKAGWTCGCEPGNYDKCFTCREMCNDLSSFLNMTTE